MPCSFKKLILCSIILILSGCKQQVNEIKDTEVFIEDKNMENENDKTNLEEALNENTSILTSEQAKDIIILANQAMLELSNNLKRKHLNEDELMEIITQYFDDSVIEQVLFMYNIKKDDRDYFSDYSIRSLMLDNQSQFFADKHDDNYIITTSFIQTHGRENMRKESCTFILTEHEDKWKIAGINQWYYSFIYTYLSGYDFGLFNFQEQEAQELIELFGIDNNEAISFGSLFNNNEQIMENSSSKILKEEDIVNLTKFEMFLAIQEIYARNGKKFASAILHTHFGSAEPYKKQLWYHPYENIFANKNINNIEKENISLLRRWLNLPASFDCREYGNLYLYEEQVPNSEELSVIINAAFSGIEKYMIKDDKHIVDDLTDYDPIIVYQLEKVYTKELFKDFLMEYFSEEILNYIYMMLMVNNGIWYYEEKDIVTFSVDGSFVDICLLDYRRKMEIISNDGNKIMLKVPIVQITTDFPESEGIIELSKVHEENWRITNVSIDYFDKLFSESEYFSEGNRIF